MFQAHGLRGSTALILAAQYGHLDVVKALLAAKAEVNASQTDGTTALLGAAGIYAQSFDSLLVALAQMAGKADAPNRSTGDWRVEMVRVLLDANADVNARLKDGSTALMIASETGPVAVVQELLAANADVNAKRNDGATALMAASHKGRQDVAELLRQHGAQQ